MPTPPITHSAASGARGLWRGHLSLPIFPMRFASRFSFLLALLLGLAACDTDGTGGSIYDPNRPSGENPVLSGVSPSSSALAGVDIITITGENFSTTPEDNLVYFGSERATVISSTATEIRVLAPNTPTPSVQIRVSVLGAENFSNELGYALSPAVEVFGELARTEVPFGITSDDEGNLYVSLVVEEIPRGIKRITPEGERSDYFASSSTWADLDFNDDELLHGVQNVQVVFRLPEGGGLGVWSIFQTSVSLTAITFDAQDNVWAGSSATSAANVYRVAPDASVQAFPFVGAVRDLVVFDNALYIAARRGEENKVWRLPISASGELGAEEVYFDASAQLGAGVAVNALAFAADGTLFLGTTAPDPVVLVSPDRSFETLYPDVIPSPVRAFAWGPGSILYMVQGAVGEAIPALFQIETRREGAD